MTEGELAAGQLVKVELEAIVGAEYEEQATRVSALKGTLVTEILVEAKVAAAPLMLYLL